MAVRGIPPIYFSVDLPSDPGFRPGPFRPPAAIHEQCLAGNETRFITKEECGGGRNIPGLPNQRIEICARNAFSASLPASVPR